METNATMYATWTPGRPPAALPYACPRQQSPLGALVTGQELRPRAMRELNAPHGVLPTVTGLPTVTSLPTVTGLPGGFAGSGLAGGSRATGIGDSDHRALGHRVVDALPSAQARLIQASSLPTTPPTTTTVRNEKHHPGPTVSRPPV